MTLQSFFDVVVENSLVDCSSAEIQDITQAVEELLIRFSGHLGEQDPRFKVTEKHGSLHIKAHCSEFVFKKMGQITIFGTYHIREQRMFRQNCPESSLLEYTKYR